MIVKNSVIFYITIITITIAVDGVVATKKVQKTGVIVQIRKPLEVSASFELARTKIPQVKRKCNSLIL